MIYKEDKTHHKMNKRKADLTRLTAPQLVYKISTHTTTPTGDRTLNRVLGKNKIHYTTSVPSISNSWPWLPSKVRDRKGAKSTKISLSRGATFSKALSSFVVMLSKRMNQEKSHKNKSEQKWKGGNIVHFHQEKRRKRAVRASQLTAVSV